ncbi:MAG: DUF917 domain-containing protein [Burkholderiales bacterium]|nr:DUF917 domain-containing protein [Anaerolineae bacterium]
MEREITLNDTVALALGAGILGTGGGGNPYIGRLWLEQELKQRGGAVRIIDAGDVADDATVCSVGMMGAPTVSNEKLQEGGEFIRNIRALEQHVHASIEALVIGEIGGSNAIKPLVAGLQLGLPVVDGDGMGRAFPELQMDTFSIGGVSSSPMALSDDYGNVIIFHKLDSPKRAEQYARILTIEMGGSAALSMPVMTGVQMKTNIIRGTLTLAQRMGETVLTARRSNTEPSEAVAALGNGRVLFRGKIVDVERRTTQGFARGRLKLVAFGDPNDVMEIVFQNENLIAWHNGEIVCTVPDLICILSLEDGESVGTESLRYGLRVTVIGMPAAKELKTPKALAVVGPVGFGYPDVTFQPMLGNLL